MNMTVPEIHLVPDAGNWSAEFLREAERLQDALAEFRPEIEHVGSTSIPGLPAKAIVDIMVTVPDLLPGSAYAPALEPLGYEFEDIGGPGRRFFRRGQPRSHHVHIVHAGSWEADRFRLFRRALAEDSEAAREYTDLKARLARQFPNDRKSYTAGKSPWIAEYLLSYVTRKALHDGIPLPHNLPDDPADATEVIYKTWRGAKPAK